MDENNDVRAGLEANESVRKAYGDPASPPDGVAIVGRVGRGETDGSWRVYDSPELTTFFEIAENDVLEVEALSPDGSKSELSTVWIKASAKVNQRISASREIQASFLEGFLTQQALALGAEGGLVAQPQCFTPTFSVSVRITIAACPATPSIVHRITQTCPS